MSDGVSCACPAIYLTGSNCFVYSLWRIGTAGTFSFKVTNAPKLQRASVIERRTGALRQVWSAATLADILMFVILPSDPVTFLKPGSVALGSQIHNPVLALPQLQRLTCSTSPSGTKTQLSPASPTLASLPLYLVPPSKPEHCIIAGKIAAFLSTRNMLPSVSLLAFPGALDQVQDFSSHFPCTLQLEQLPFAHNCCNDLSMAAIHSYIPMSTPTHTPVHKKHSMCWLMKDRAQ